MDQNFTNSYQQFLFQFKQYKVITSGEKFNLLYYNKYFMFAEFAFRTKLDHIEPTEFVPATKQYFNEIFGKRSKKDVVEDEATREVKVKEIWRKLYSLCRREHPDFDLRSITNYHLNEKNLPALKYCDKDWGDGLKNELWVTTFTDEMEQYLKLPEIRSQNFNQKPTKRQRRSVSPKSGSEITAIQSSEPEGPNNIIVEEFNSMRVELDEMTEKCNSEIDKAASLEFEMQMSLNEKEAKYLEATGKLASAESDRTRMIAMIEELQQNLTEKEANLRVISEKLAAAENNRTQIEEIDSLESLRMSARFRTGLKNSDNQCYQNACYRVLILMDPIFKHFTSNASTSLTKSSTELSLPEKDDVAFRLFLKKFLSSPDHSYDASHLCVEFGGTFNIHTMEDAEEYLSYVINKLREYEPNKSVFETTIHFDLVRHFGVCQSCNTVKVPNREVDLAILSIEVPPNGSSSLVNCLGSFFATEDVDVLCDNESCKRKGFRSGYFFSKVGKYLIIQFKRFKPKGSQYIRVMTSISLPDTINLKDFSVSSMQSKGYRLLMIIHHLLIGKSTSLKLGHYTVSLRSGGKWLYFNDDNITLYDKFQVSWEKSCYICIYERID